MLIRDIEIEMYPSKKAKVFIGKDALGRNIYQDSKPCKAKNDPSGFELPLFATNQINPKGIKNHGTQS